MTRLLLLCVLGSLITSCYTVREAYYQTRLLMSKRPVKEVEKDPQTNLLIKTKLKQVAKLRQFAKEHGLEVGDAYTEYIATDRKVISYTLACAPPTQLELKTWWFPFVGSVPYLGFYHRKDRDREAEYYEKKGYDVYRGAASAFSGLGWFDEPLLTYMLTDYTDWERAHLLFHELTHRSIWIKNHAGFNENLAEFVAEQLTISYLKQAQNWDQIDDYQAYRHDRLLYKTWLSQLKTRLGKLYHKHLDDQIMRAEKKRIINTQLSALPAFKSHHFNWIKKVTWNNARIMAAQLYQPKTELLEKSFRCHQFKDFSEFFSLIRKLAKKNQDLYDALIRSCPSTTS